MHNYLSITEPVSEGFTITLPPGRYRIGDPMRLFSDEFIELQWRPKGLQTGVFYDLRDASFIGCVSEVEPGDGTYYGKEWAVFDASVRTEPLCIADIEVTTTSGTLAVVDAAKYHFPGQGILVHAYHGGALVMGPTFLVIRTPYWQLRMDIK